MAWTLFHFVALPEYGPALWHLPPPLLDETVTASHLPQARSNGEIARQICPEDDFRPVPRPGRRLLAGLNPRGNRRGQWIVAGRALPLRILGHRDFEAGVSESTFLPSSPMLPASDWPRLRRQDGAATVPETRRFVTEMAELERAR